ncbi:MAG: hypothetical protein GF388_01860, partial [Candidatus Aegiribacteria sp.]|nr:hypothetical protein [Candidatus Aegiribacteria sp.]MBD3294103.1 hypothetical protein [Candidatus Fermentibacteria bacterium]
MLSKLSIIRNIIPGDKNGALLRILLLVLLVSSRLAADTTGLIGGSVTDPQGAPLV